MPDPAQAANPTAWKRIMAWVAGATAILGLVGTLSGGFTWLQNHRAQQAELDSQIALARTQNQQADYQAAVQTTSAILKTNPLYRPALDQQLSATMLWTENFHAIAPEGQTATDAAPNLDQIFPILEAGLTRTTGPQAADIQAHLGWAHWLNQHIAEREFGPAAQQNLQAALQTDPSNVYANAMLGNILLQTGGSFPEAVSHLNTAVATAKARPFVRSLQLGGLTGDETPGARAQVFKAANDIRQANEPLDQDTRSRILSFCCSPTLATHAQLVESLSAVPPADAANTYRWLQGQAGEADSGQAGFDSQFIAATLLEISGKPADALEKYRALQQQLKSRPGSLSASVDEAIAHLSHP